MRFDLVFWLAAETGAVLLVAAGVAKLIRPGPTRRSALSQGIDVSASLVRVFGVVELVSGAAAIVAGDYAHAATAALYFAFAAFMVRGLVRGDLASCGCFGLEDTPPTWAHAAQNGLIAFSAGWSAWMLEPGIWRGESTVTAIIWVILVGVAALGVATLMVRGGRSEPIVNSRSSRIVAPMSDTNPGASTDLVPAFDIVGRRPDGDADTVQLEEGVTGVTLVAFLSTTCGICTEIWRGLPALGRRHPEVLLVVATKESPQDDEARVQSLAADHDVRVVMSTEAWADYEVPGSPYAVVVDGTRSCVVTEGPVRDIEEVRSLLRQVESASR